MKSTVLVCAGTVRLIESHGSNVLRSKAIDYSLAGLPTLPVMTKGITPVPKRAASVVSKLKSPVEGSNVAVVKLSE